MTSHADRLDTIVGNLDQLAGLLTTLGVLKEVTSVDDGGAMHACAGIARKASDDLVVLMRETAAA